MIARFFIDRPIFAAVLSIVITLAGVVSMGSLPVALYPHIAPPTVQVDAKYPGASAQVVAETVAAPIEQKVNGVEGMLYMSSQCTNDGSYNLTVTFQHGMDLNMAQVLVQNRVALAMPLLPDVLKQAGVTARKKSPDILMAIAINSPSNRYGQLYLSNFATLKLKDELARLPGISDVTMLGQQDYSMRIWVDPEKLAARDLTASDVVAALREQNRPVATGQVGQPPVPVGQDRQLTLNTLGRLELPEEFGSVIVKATTKGQVVRLRDVANVEIGPKAMDISTQVNGRPSASLAIFMLPDANALETADVVMAKMEEMSRDFPEGVQYEVRYNTTPFIRESINEVYKTLGESVALVAIVVLLFLQNWRSALIPLVAVPVGIIGSFAVLLAMGFSINNLTLFGLVLAIGIVVDDAIVVVEAVEHHLERGLAPREATIVAMSEVSGPVIAIGLVLTAVFVPCAFITGIVGQFFRQFALTIASSTIISTFNSLTLSPALAAMLLKPRDPSGRPAEPLPKWGIALLGGGLAYMLFGQRVAALHWVLAHGPTGLAALAERLVPNYRSLIAGFGGQAAIGTVIVGFLLGRVLARPVNGILGAIFAGFNAGFRWINEVYARGVAVLLRVIIGVVLVYVGMMYLTVYGFELDAKSWDRFATSIEQKLAKRGVPNAAPRDRDKAPAKPKACLPRPFPPDRYFKIPGLANTPKGFIPSQDMGYLLVNVQLPDSASLERSQETMQQIEKIALDVPGVAFTYAITGQSLLLSAFGSNFGSMFLILDSFDNRHGHDLYGETIRKKLQDRLNNEVLGARIVVLGPPPVRGVGRAGGFKLMVEDRGSSDLATLQGQTDHLSETAAKSKGKLTGMTTVFRANVPQFSVEVDRKECLTKQVALRDLYDTLQIYLGSLYVNDFNLFGRTWQVIVQAESRFRNAKDDVRGLKVRNAQGKMVPIGALAEIQEKNGPLILTRYNMYTAAPINGAAAPGVSSGEAIELMENVAKRELLPTMAIEWTELAYLELQAGNTAMMVFGFAVVMVFLVLAAQYESWSLPLAVILVVPLCLLSAIAGVNIAKQDINIFTQIGFVVLVGLACKNAILMVEFARAQRLKGKPRVEAALDSCRLRLRPIVMTSMAFILGVVPLLVSHGAGAEMRQTLGTTVFSGMLGVTVFGVILTPIFFVLIDWLAETRLFRSPALRAIGGVTLAALGPGLIRRLARRVPRGKDEPVEPDNLPAVAIGHHIENGNGNGNGSTAHHDEPGTLVERD